MMLGNRAMQWDGNDYQFLSRASVIAGGVGLAIADAHVSVLVVMSIFFLLIGVGLVPKGPQPPVD